MKMLPRGNKARIFPLCGVGRSFKRGVVGTFHKVSEKYMRMLNHLRKHWRSRFVALLSIVVILSIVWFSNAFQDCIQKSYYESSDYEPEKGISQVIGALRWSKTCTGEFLKEDGEAITAFLRW
jgi:hypothetical protein